MILTKEQIIIIMKKNDFFGFDIIIDENGC